MNQMNRREFLFSTGAVTLLSSACLAEVLGDPELRLGVISDIHLTTPKSCRLFEKSLRIFKRRGVDAVLIAGDLTDWGLRSGFAYTKATWDRVFAGTKVVPLFCSGNHDYLGFAYGDMTLEMHANGYSEDDACVRNGGVDACWQEAFGEPFAGVRRRTVKGYDFISGEWEGNDLEKWMETNGGSLPKDKPFFYFQHAPIAGTTSDSSQKEGGDKIHKALSAFPNCIAFTGHTHRPFIDERSIWQGEFTTIAIPSLSYADSPAGYENGNGQRYGSPKQAMMQPPWRRDLRGGQGYFVNVWKDRVVVERYDMEEDESDALDWVIPLSAERPFDNARRAPLEPVPAFPANAALDIETRNTENRSGSWMIVLNCEFPSAVVPKGHRVYDYEIVARPLDGSTPLVKKFVSPAYAQMAKYEPKIQRFWFDAAELPQDKDYRIEVRARNCFGRESAPLVSEVRHGCPGLQRVAPAKTNKKD